MKTNIIITEEMLNKIQTDSDIRDLADELGVSYKELDYAVGNKLLEDTKCYNCKYISFRYFAYPCTSCSRIVILKDMYESVDLK